MKELELERPDVQFIRGLNIIDILNLKLEDLGLGMKDIEVDENITACKALFGWYEGRRIQDSKTITPIKPLNLRVLETTNGRGIIKVESSEVTELLYKRLFELYESGLGSYGDRLTIEKMLMVGNLDNLEVTSYDVRDSLEEEILSNKEITYGDLGFVDYNVKGYHHIKVRDRLDLLQIMVDNYTYEKPHDKQLILGNKYLNLDSLTQIQVKLIDEVGKISVNGNRMMNNGEKLREEYVEEQASYLTNIVGIKETAHNSKYSYSATNGKTITFTAGYGVKISSGIQKNPGITIESNTIAFTFDVSILKDEKFTMENISTYQTPDINKRVYFNGMNPILDTITVMGMGGVKDSILFDLLFESIFVCNDYTNPRISTHLLHNEFRNWYSKGAINYGQFPFGSRESLGKCLTSKYTTSDKLEIDRFTNLDLQETRDNKHLIESQLEEMSFGIEEEIEPYFRELLLYDKYLNSILTDGRPIINYEYELTEVVLVLTLNEYLRTILNRFTSMNLGRGIEIKDKDKFLKTMRGLVNGTLLKHLNES